MGSIIDRVQTKGAKARRYIIFKDLDGRQRWSPTPKGTSMAQAKALLRAAETNVANGKVGIIPAPKPEETQARRVTLGALIDRFCAEYTNPKVKDLERYRADARSSLGTHVKLHRIAALPAIEVSTQQLRDWRPVVEAGEQGERLLHRLGSGRVLSGEQLVAEMRDKDGDLGFHAALEGAHCHRVRFHDLRHPLE
jgi:hypothetical protein